LIGIVIHPIFLPMEDAMTNDIKLPRKLSDEPEAAKPQRPSHEKVIEQLDRWANSPGLRPPSRLQTTEIVR
jgi:hypothetical protein